MSIRYLDEGEPCVFCKSNNANFWGNPYKTKYAIYLSPVCEYCAAVEIALNEADADMRRYTYIATTKKGAKNVFLI